MISITIKASLENMINTFQLFKILNNDIGKLVTPMPLTDDIMHTQSYNKVDEYNTLYYTNHLYKQDKFEETVNYIYKIFLDFETITSGETKQHMPYLCWIYTDDLQQECVGINTCAADMLNALPTDQTMYFINCS